MTYRICILVLLLCLSAAIASAQSLAADIHVGVAGWSEFESVSDLGIGGRLTWRPLPVVSLEADVTFYPEAFPDEPSRFGTFSAHRIEGLFGATLGPQLGRFRPFAKASVGFLDVRPSSDLFACVQIFPPPLTCLLAAGQTLPAYELGGGVEVATLPRQFIRLDVSERVLKYPGPSYNTAFEQKDDGFFGHALRLTGGYGLRF